jgi:hypothetical protein
MNLQAPKPVLVASEVVSSYVIILAGTFVPRFFEVAYKLKVSERALFTPPLTLWASAHVWVFVVGILSIAIGSIILLFRRPNDAMRILAMTLCAHGAVVWLAMFCYCENGFFGAASMRHVQEFDIGEFVAFGRGVFPVTFAALLFPVVALRFRRKG